MAVKIINRSGGITKGCYDAADGENFFRIEHEEIDIAWMERNSFR